MSNKLYIVKVMRTSVEVYTLRADSEEEAKDQVLSGEYDPDTSWFSNEQATVEEVDDE